MTTASDDPVKIKSTDSERREIYRTLDIRQKLQTGQAYLVQGRVMRRPPVGSFPPGTQSRMVRIYLSINNWHICFAHQYVNSDGSDYTEPDPKYIRVDDVVFTQ